MSGQFIARCIARTAIVLSLGIAVAQGGVLYVGTRVFPGFQSPDPEASDFSFAGGTVSSSQTSSFGDASFSGSATAEAAYGVLKASAEATIVGYQGVNFYGTCPSLPSIDCSVDPASGTAGFGDTYTITGGTGTGYLVLNFDITGSVSYSGTAPSGYAGAQGIFTLRQGTELPLSGSIVESVPLVGDLNYTSPAISFTFGDPLALAMNLDAFVWVFDSSGEFLPGVLYDHSGTANFGNTVVLSGLKVYSDPGLTQELFNLNLTTGSGTNYDLPTGPVSGVPEPSTYIMMGAGLSALALLRRRCGARS